MKELVNTLAKLLSVEKAVNVAFITIITLGLTAVQVGDFALASIYFQEYFIILFIIYISIPLIKCLHKYIQDKVGYTNDEKEAEKDKVSKSI